MGREAVRNNDTRTKPSLEEQLDKAEAAVLRGRQSTNQLHIWWRKYLFFLSLLMLFFSFHQAKKPGEECMKAAQVRKCALKILLEISANWQLKSRL